MYLAYCPYGRFSNQLFSLWNMLALARRLGRGLVLPPLMDGDPQRLLELGEMERILGWRVWVAHTNGSCVEAGARGDALTVCTTNQPEPCALPAC
jgi:hypothetical protein